jgi:hypothetical protein
MRPFRYLAETLLIPAFMEEEEKKVHNSKRAYRCNANQLPYAHGMRNEM